MTKEILKQRLGSASVHYQMVNEISRKYFTRAFGMSSSVFSSWAMRKANHVQQIQECTYIRDIDKLIEYLKTANSSELVTCYAWVFPGELDTIWVPTIENLHSPNAFLTQTPEEIYKSDKAPKMDAMFSFTAQVRFGLNDLKGKKRTPLQANTVGFVAGNFAIPVILITIERAIAYTGLE